jgi:hypothetical protein
MEHEQDRKKPDEDAVLEDANEDAAIWGIIIIILVIVIIITSPFTLSWSDDKVRMKHQRWLCDQCKCGVKLGASIFFCWWIVYFF